jgi:hypothetical protein
MAQKKDPSGKRRRRGSDNQRGAKQNTNGGKRGTKSGRITHLAGHKVSTRHHVCYVFDVHTYHTKTTEGDANGISGVVLLGWNFGRRIGF